MSLKQQGRRSTLRLDGGMAKPYPQHNKEEANKGGKGREERFNMKSKNGREAKGRSAKVSDLHEAAVRENEEPCESSGSSISMRNRQRRRRRGERPKNATSAGYTNTNDKTVVHENLARDTDTVDVPCRKGKERTDGERREDDELLQLKKECCSNDVEKKEEVNTSTLSNNNKDNPLLPLSADAVKMSSDSPPRTKQQSKKRERKKEAHEVGERNGNNGEKEEGVSETGHGKSARSGPSSRPTHFISLRMPLDTALVREILAIHRRLSGLVIIPNGELLPEVKEELKKEEENGVKTPPGGDDDKMLAANEEDGKDEDAAKEMGNEADVQHESHPRQEADEEEGSEEERGCCEEQRPVTTGGVDDNVVTAAGGFTQQDLDEILIPVAKFHITLAVMTVPSGDGGVQLLKKASTALEALCEAEKVRAGTRRSPPSSPPRVHSRDGNNNDGGGGGVVDSGDDDDDDNPHREEATGKTAESNSRERRRRAEAPFRLIFNGVNMFPGKRVLFASLLRSSTIADDVNTRTTSVATTVGGPVDAAGASGESHQGVPEGDLTFSKDEVEQVKGPCSRAGEDSREKKYESSERKKEKICDKACEEYNRLVLFVGKVKSALHEVGMDVLGMPKAAEENITDVVQEEEGEERKKQGKKNNKEGEEEEFTPHLTLAKVGKPRRKGGVGHQQHHLKKLPSALVKEIYGHAARFFGEEERGAGAEKEVVFPTVDLCAMNGTEADGYYKTISSCSLLL